MPSSCNVIKGTVVSGLEMIVTPAIDTEEEQKSPEYADEANDISINETYNTAFQEAELAKKEILDNAKREAEAIIEDAKANSKELIKASKDEGYQQGYKVGYQQGYSYGLEESKKEGLQLKEEAEKYLDDCKNSVKAYIKEKEESIIDLSIEIARHIINTEITMNPDAIYKMAHLAISKVADKQQVILRVSPQDVPLLINKKEELSIFTSNPSDIILIPDASIKQGCVTAETSSGFADTDIDKQLEETKKLLAGD